MSATVVCVALFFAVFVADGIAQPAQPVAQPAAQSVARPVATQAMASRFVPSDDTTIVENLPSSTRMMRRLRSESSARPDDLQLALRNSRRFIELNRAEGDPRFLGYAQAALAPWWSGQDPRVMLLRATIRQARHEFDPALADLRDLTQRMPDDAQAWLTLASVEQVLGNYPRVLVACQQVQRLLRDLLGAACVAEVRNLTGDHAAFRELLAGFRSTPAADPATRGWLATVLAEMAWREGAGADTQSLFEDAMRASPTLYLRAAYADFLIGQGQAARALEVGRWPDPALDTWPDVLLLRHLLALQALGRDIAGARAELQQRFDAARLRGDAQHGREEARFVLAVDADPARALELALHNWTRQKEPADALLLADSARAAGRADVIDQLRRYVRDSGFSDRRLQRVLDEPQASVR